MSRETTGIVRQPLAVAARPRRSLEERVGLRFPGVLALVDRLVWRLPPRSRLRRAPFGRAARLALEPHNRGDFEAAVVRYDPQVELVSDSRLVHGRVIREQFFFDHGAALEPVGLGE